MPKQIQCSIIITEVDGKLHIMGNIPDNASGSIAVAMAEALLGQSQAVMNQVLGDSQKIEKMASN